MLFYYNLSVIFGRDENFKGCPKIYTAVSTCKEPDYSSAFLFPDLFEIWIKHAQLHSSRSKCTLIENGHFSEQWRGTTLYRTGYVRLGYRLRK